MAIGRYESNPKARLINQVQNESIESYSSQNPLIIQQMRQKID